MAEINNIIVEHLKALRNDVQALRTTMLDEFKDLKQRLTSLERGQAKSHADYADLYGDHARQQAAIDRLSDRIERIERRLELSDS